MIYVFKCKTCGERAEIQSSPDKIIGLKPICQVCPNTKEPMVRTYEGQSVYVRRDWNSHTQFDVMDPRAFAGKGSSDRRDFVNETYGEKEPLFGDGYGGVDPAVTDLEPLSVGD